MNPIIITRLQILQVTRDQIVLYTTRSNQHLYKREFCFQWIAACYNNLPKVGFLYLYLRNLVFEKACI